MHMLTYGPITVTRVNPRQSSATAYLRAGRIIFHGVCLTTIGGLACDPYLNLDAAASDVELGSTLLDVLSKAHIATVPTNCKEEQKKILRTAGVRSWSKLSEGAVCCSVRKDPDVISVLPTRSAGKAFLDLPDLIVRVSASSTPVEIGRSLRDGFQKCT